MEPLTLFSFQLGIVILALVAIYILQRLIRIVPRWISGYRRRRDHIHDLWKDQQYNARRIDRIEKKMKLKPPRRLDWE